MWKSASSVPTRRPPAGVWMSRSSLVWGPFIVVWGLALALARYDARISGDAPNGQLEVFLDEHFDNARMERIYPNAKKVIKAE